MTTSSAGEEPTTTTASTTTAATSNTESLSSSRSDNAPTATTVSAAFSDSEFQQWLLQGFQEHHEELYRTYPTTFVAATQAITKWRIRYKEDPKLWKRIFDKERIRKEFIEALPILDAVIRLVENDANAEEQQFTVVDLASGKGYLSMLLSEMLPPTKVKQFVLMDKAWAAHNIGKPQPQHINWDHIYGCSYYESWPIPLNTSKQDLKSGRQRKALENKFFPNTGERIIMLAVHLCGILSLKAVDFFNHNSTIEFFCLKPCCLPGMIHAKRKEIFRFTKSSQRQQQKEQQQEQPTENANDNNQQICQPVSSGGAFHSFDSKKVCMPGKWNKNVWKGPNRNALRPFFERWATNLFLGIGITDSSESKGEVGEESPLEQKPHKQEQDSAEQQQQQQQQQEDQYERYQQGPIATKLQKNVPIQTDGGYQNEFLFAQRLPTTNQVWDKLLSQ